MVNEPATGPGRVSSATTAPPQDSLLEIVWRRRATVIVCLILAVGVAWAYLSITPKVYTATSRLLVQHVSPSLSADGGSSDAEQNYLQTQCELLRSTPIVAAALGTLDADSLKTLSETR